MDTGSSNKKATPPTTRATKLAAKPAAKPVTKSVAKPSTKPSTKPAAKSVAKSVAKSAAKRKATDDANDSMTTASTSADSSMDKGKKKAPPKPPAPKRKDILDDDDDDYQVDEDTTMDSATDGPVATRAKRSGKDSAQASEDNTVLYGGTLRALCRVAEDAAKERVKELAMEYAVQDMTRQAEDSKQRTFTQQTQWFDRLQAALNDFPQGSEERVGFVDLVFKQAVTRVIEAETQLEAQKSAVRTKDIHIKQLEIELLTLTKKMETMTTNQNAERASAAIKDILSFK
ncbi:hypothetical protein FS749_008355 [Ceratobasidium sp. UAMH 11750]|nr:hypothetical protein FS749_008355 [Ceratobasidium sp. UAMH 11750]